MPEFSNLDEIAARLRATSGTASSAFKRGYAEGQAWAADEAELDDLELLESVDVEGELLQADAGAIGVATSLAKGMGADDAQYLFGEDAQHHWRDDSQSKITPNRLRGFVAGALDIYHRAVTRS